MASDTIVKRLFEQAERRPTAPAYSVRESSGWKATNYRKYAAEVKQAARALIALEFETGQNVAILGFNRPEWSIICLAAMAAGGAAAGVYTTCSPPEVQYIVDHAEAPMILVENQDQWAKIEAELERLPKLRHVILMRGAPAIDHDMVMTWEEFMAHGDDAGEAELDARVEALEPDGLATLIYTSGTTGPPKGVMLTHENLAWTAKQAYEINDMTSADSSLSYLPLSHIAEQTFSIHVPCTVGSHVYYAEAIDKVPDNLKEVQPTVFFGVPRIWEKFNAAVSGKLDELSGLKEKLTSWARGVASEVAKVRARGGEPTGLLDLQYKLAGKLIFSKLKPALGLGRARICVSGAAPIAREVLEFFASLDLIILEVYGQSEDSGPTSFNLPRRFRFGSVGPIFPGVDVKIADDGEILVKGPNVFKGYYKDEAATAETLIDGWLYSGDLGEIRDGFLYITGRKKEIIITAGGKNVAPKNIEAALKNHDLVNEAVVVGDRRKYLVALLTLDPDLAETWAKKNGTSVDALPDHSGLNADVRRHVDEMNKEFAPVEQIKKFKILPRNLSQEEGELTPTLKVKRKAVHEHFADEIDSMYE